MVVRILALLLAILMMTGAATQVCASPEVVSEIDDASDLDAPVVPAVVLVPRPGRRTPVSIEAPRSLGRGRLLAVFVFRPPRLVASR